MLPLRIAAEPSGVTHFLPFTADIGPILGAQPGSEAWTKNRDHDAWRLMTKYFVEQYKELAPSNPDVSQLANGEGTVG
jgi:hypothetical protein